MTIEEKAKAYDEARERVKNLENTTIEEDALMKYIFPEFAESEDEKAIKLIRSLLVNARNVQSNTSLYKQYDDALAWLEKQKELPTNEEMLRTLRAEYEKGVADTIAKYEQKEQNGENEECTDFVIYHPLKNGKGKYECIPYSFYGSLTSFSEDKDLIDFLRTCFYTEEECNEWIEQQKEQKPSIFPPILGEVHWNPIQSGKDANKWNLPEDFEEAVYKVANFISPFDSQDELRRVSHRFAEQLMSLAKKELMEKSAEWDKLQAEFRSINEAFEDGKKEVVDHPKKYGLCKSAEWSEEDEKTIWGLTAYIPDEELERLGITRFDILKKLKSLCPQPIQLKEAYKDGFQTSRHAMALAFMNNLDENRPKGKMGLSNGECEDIDKAFKEGDWAKIMRYVEKYSPQSKQEWSEEDEKTIGYACCYLNEYGNHIADVNVDKSNRVYKTADALKLLRPHPKQEWSEEDLQHKSWILECLADGERKMPEYAEDFRAAYKWLKSLPLNLKKKNEDVAKLCSNEWSEKDEDKLYQIIETLLADKEVARRENPQHYDALSKAYDELISWLKSLPLNLKKKNEDVAKLCSNEWSEEDEMIYQHCKTILHDYGYDDWFKSLRSNSKQEWSDEDERIWKALIDYFSGHTVFPSCTDRESVHFLKSLRPSWKPSKEQMRALDKVINGEVLLTTQHKSLESLSEQLKKL